MTTDHPTGTIDTKFGKVNYSLTQADHVYIKADEIVCFGVRYHASYHVYLIGGEWKHKDYHDLYLARSDRSLKEPSMKATKAVREVLAAAWSDFITGKNDLLNVAERKHIQSEIERAEAQVQEATDALNQATAKVHALGVKLLDLGGPV